MTKEQLQIELNSKQTELRLAHDANLDLRERILKLETRVNNLIKNETNLLNDLSKDNVNYNMLERGIKMLNEIIKP